MLYFNVLKGEKWETYFIALPWGSYVKINFPGHCGGRRWFWINNHEIIYEELKRLNWAEMSGTVEPGFVPQGARSAAQNCWEADGL